MSVAMQNVPEIELKEAKRMVKFLRKFEERPASDFEGVFHHLHINWRDYASKSSNDNDVIEADVLFEILKNEDKKLRKNFGAQVVYAFLRQTTEELFDAAFGKGELVHV